MHARWWEHTTVADGWIVRKMDGSDGMKRHRRRERRTDVGWAGLFLTALIFPQVGLKRNRWRYKGTGRQLSHTDQCYHPQTKTQQTVAGDVHTCKAWLEDWYLIPWMTKISIKYILQADICYVLFVFTSAVVRTDVECRVIHQIKNNIKYDLIGKGTKLKWLSQI